jgi:hypothetical protein
MRTWHGVEVARGAQAGLRGFLVGACPDNPDLVQVWWSGGGPLACCVPPSRLTARRTLHGGRTCPGVDCTEGDPINLGREAP